MTTLDPIVTTRRLEATYSRYLRSTLRPRDPGLRAELERELTGPSSRLIKGPYLQAAAPYVLGSTIRQLTDAGVLDAGVLALDPAAFSVNRRLYAHQERAIRHIVTGKNALVATGTGSGKTESFMVPILDHLLRERTAGTLSQHGVRALLLYPMNALANDQLKRLRGLLGTFPDITFGRYTGETADSHTKALETYKSLHGFEPLSNELISREEINTTPPHILITNFAMLEYLLLRPKDSTLFDGPTGRHWRFMALDEVHVYDGSKGAEIAYLLRRLKDRVVDSEPGRLICVGTSATLGSGAQDRPRLIRFAEQLFDEPFDVDCLIEPERQQLATMTATWEITDDQVNALLAVAPPDDDARDQNVEELVAAAAAAGCPPVEATDRFNTTLYRLMSTESRTLHLRQRLSAGSVSVSELQGSGGADPQALVSLVQLAWRAVDDTDIPLLPARYHAFARSLEGAFICIDPEHPGPTRLWLDRQLHCPACLSVGRQRLVFEFGSCRKCGSGYVLGEAEKGPDGDRLVPAGLNERSLVHLLIDDADDTFDDDENIDQDENVEDDAADKNLLTPGVVCVHCGAFGDPEVIARCCDEPTHRTAQKLKAGKGGVSRRCGACGGQSKTNVVFRYLSGADAVGAVLASALYQELPAAPIDHEAVNDAFAGGRKLLAFSDSRQSAAFFAPYLQRTHSAALERRIIWEALSELTAANPGRPHFSDLVPRVRSVAERHGLYDANASSFTKADIARAWLSSEILAVDSSQNLEGVGLAMIAPVIPDLAVPPGILPHGGTPDGVLSLMKALLNTLRTRNAVKLHDAVDISDERFSPRNFVTYVRGTDPDQKTISWAPKSAYHNSRLDLVERYFARIGTSTDPRSWLNDAWGWLTDARSGWSATLPGLTVSGFGAVRQLDAEMIEFVPAGDLARPLRCGTCQAITWFDLAGVCTRYRCTGTVAPAEPSASDHYYLLYTNMAPIAARVEEHTAQLDSLSAAERQAEFARGAVNVLSCSTTFELGVDLGDIQAVFLRNVPPGPANYVQRAGRAGRRAGSPALIVTMAQRRNHDLHFFAHPTLMIDGVVEPPVIEVDNAHIARRHVHSVALAAFLRERADMGLPEPSTVEEFFIATDSEPSAADAWSAWLRTRKTELQGALRRLLPTSVSDELGVEDWDWVGALVDPPVNGDNGWLYVCIAEVTDTLEGLQRRITEITATDKPSRFKQADQIQRVYRSVARTPMLSQLARRIVLPKYGFPVDTVELDLTRTEVAAAMRLDLSRDLALAIVEYSPGAQVVADNSLWQSDGVKIPHGLALQRRKWRVCVTCESLTVILAELLDDADQPVCKLCGSGAASAHGTYIWPSHGFIGNYVGKAGERRPDRTGWTDSYFADYLHPAEPEMRQLHGHPVTVITSRHGEVHLINSGAGGGFRFCGSCGRMEQRPTGTQKGGSWKHTRPGTNTKCAATNAQMVSLGHHYCTDVTEIRLDAVGNVQDYYSALQALLSGLPALGIKPGDVRGMLRTYQLGSPPGLILVDAVPGGAGYAQHIAAELDALMHAAHERVSSCSCAIESSCYGCLRTYENQRRQDELSRQAALRVLEPYVTVT
jgi:ATP-dependent helicase YprA (DUF1998 family)